MSLPQFPVPQGQPNWIRYGPVPRYGHQTQAWQQPDPAQVGHRPGSAAPAWTVPYQAPQWATAIPPARPAKDPGQVLGIVGLVMAFLGSFIGLALHIGAVIRSHRAGYVNVPAIIGIPVAVVILILSAIYGATVSAMIADCLEPGSGVLVAGDDQVTCPVRS